LGSSREIAALGLELLELRQISTDRTEITVMR
jgi:hypothetical protein